MIDDAVPISIFLSLLIVIAISICIIHVAVLSSKSIVCWWCSTYDWTCKYAAAAFDWCCNWYVNVYFCSLLLPVLELMLLLLLIDVLVYHVILMLLVLYLKMLYYCWCGHEFFCWYLCFWFCYTIHLAVETSICDVCWCIGINVAVAIEWYFCSFFNVYSCWSCDVNVTWIILEDAVLLLVGPWMLLLASIFSVCVTDCYYWLMILILLQCFYLCWLLLLY